MQRLPDSAALEMKLGRRQGPLPAFLLFGAAVAVLVFTVAWFKRPYPFDVDSEWYIKLAEGRIGEVIKPFSNRVLHPFIILSLQHAFQMSADAAFLAVGTLSVAVFVASVTLISTSQIPFPATAALFASPFLLRLFQDYYLPDVLYAAILSLYFVCLYKERYYVSMIVLLFLFLTRESTLLLAIVVFGVCVYERRWTIALSSVATTVVGLLIVRHAASFGQPNIHNLNDVVYIVLKLPFNFLKNICGITLWTDTLAVNDPRTFSHSPIWLMNLTKVPLGSIHFAGIYEFNWGPPVATLISFLSTFGVTPSLVVRDLTSSKFRNNHFSGAPFWFLIALIYGLLSFFVGPMTGASVGRLIGYGWPCFFVAFPFILRRRYSLDRKFMFRLFAASIIAAWLPYLSDGSISVVESLVIICILVALHTFAVREAIQNTYG
jgi:hypothetical protein